MDAGNDLVIYGASGHARAFASTARRGLVPQIARRVAAFIDDFDEGLGRTLDGAPVMTFDQWNASSYASTPCLLSMGSPVVKQRLRIKLELAGATFADIYAGRPASLFELAVIGKGSFICEHTYVGTNTVIGDHTQMMPLCSIGHDVVIGDCCTICPSCTVSGHVVIEDGVFVGAGTTIVEGREGAPLRIGRGAKIWAGSVVTRSVAAGTSVGGNPAVPLRDLARRRAATAVAEAPMIDMA